MMGTGTFAEPTLKALLAGPNPVVGLVTQPERAAGAQRGSTRQVGEGMRAIAEAAGVPVIQPESINTPEGVAALRAWQPDLLVVAAFGQLLKRDVIESARLGAVNVHASLLPKYRGAAPIAWAIYHGETRTGVTIFQITTGMDTGDILAQEATEIGPDETAGDVEARLAPMGAQLALRVVGELGAGTAVRVKQDAALATKAPKLKKEDGLIDWSRPAAQVRNQIRAMQPWPTAYTFFHKSGPPTRVLILKARVLPFPGSHENAPLGCAFAIPDTSGKIRRLGVNAGDRTAVEVLELQPAGKRRMTAEEFTRGRSIAPTDHFGPETA
jgi:methionyl-tRNA formyltransferase